jgi:hypothetical protein
MKLATAPFYYLLIIDGEELKKKIKLPPKGTFNRPLYCYKIQINAKRGGRHMESENKIFRKTALDRISSPEQLSEAMKVAGPWVWCMMAGLAAVFVAFFVWGVLGKIPVTVEMTGTAVAPLDEPLAVYSFLSIDESKPLSQGMAVRVSPDYAPKEQYGYIYGTIKSIGHAPIMEDELLEVMGSEVVLLTVPSGNVVKVVIELQTYDDGELRWSKPKDAPVFVMEGSLCDLTVITAERRPIDLMFG